MATVLPTSWAFPPSILLFLLVGFAFIVTVGKLECSHMHDLHVDFGHVPESFSFPQSSLFISIAALIHVTTR